ncbi:MAG TPA: hypothetical protein VN661_06815 [Candidatus Acidoferrales bacterium]|nr:hypothetical protein [Candidatus Acidoferrales bacterium]
MDQTRRVFCAAVFPLAAAVPRAFAAQARTQDQQQQAGPQQSRGEMPAPPVHGPNPNHQPDVPPFDKPAKPNPVEVLNRNHEEISDDVRQLYSLARKLRDQLWQSNSTKVLSIAAINDTKEIEKLAKHIRKLLSPG